MAATMKHMAANFSKLDNFEGMDFRRWQKKMHFFLTSMSVVYVLRTPIPETNKYMAEDASSKKFLESNFNNYKMVDSRPIMEQYNELLRILDFKHTLKHKKEELTLVELCNYLRIKKSPRAQEIDKPKSNNVAGSSVINMVEHNNSTRLFVIELNEFVSINSLIELRDAIFYEHIFSSIPRPSHMTLNTNGTDDIVEGIMDEVSNQHSYCFIVEDDPKTFDEAMKSQDVAF
ncbi:hypothetical protein Tco_1056343 [Tanacetum coccineum]|uniref:Zinc finger, CCHC-type n=1 Tax=Tanacetum coccineum TaxID=301880 RepID=A0ABQ5H3D0_9ASTR